MSKISIIKEISGIGKIEYKVASSRKELEGAYSLIYKEYLMRGFIVPEYYRSKLRVTLYNALPETITFVGLKNREVVITSSIIPDSPLGLPMDMGYKEEADSLRRAGRKICEGGYLAIKTELFGRGLFSMFNFRKLEFLFTIFKMLLHYALFYKKFDDLCIVTNPKYMIFKFLPFEIIGEVKYYGYDVASVRKRAAVAKRLDLKYLREIINKNKPYLLLGARLGLYKMFLGSKIPKEVFDKKYNFTLQDLHYFFVKRSDTFKKAKKKEREYLRKCYNLSEEEFSFLFPQKYR